MKMIDPCVSDHAGNGAYKQIRIVRRDYRLTENSTNATLRVTKGASGDEISTGDSQLTIITPNGN